MFEIILTEEAKEDLRSMRRVDIVKILDAIEAHLSHDPTKLSKSRIKRLQQLTQPQFRLRIDDFRVFYDVSESCVTVLGVVPKSQAEQWLKEKGKP